MAREGLEVADVFRRFGPAFRDRHGASLSAARRRAMTAIESCRTAALGGHVERCGDCGHQRVAYNSCLMGKFSNGESAGGSPLFDVAHAPVLLSITAVSRSKAISLSGGRKAPLRRCGGTIASIASSFSVGSPRV